MMVKKYSLVLILLLEVLFLSGCWNYIGLDEIGIATAMAIDIDEETKEFLTTYEIVDMARSSKETGIKSKIVESQGPTIFAAIRNAKKKLSDKLYFGNTNILIISESVAREKGLYNIIDFFMRDHEPRENMNIFVSQEGTAESILTSKTLDSSLIALVLLDLVQEDHNLLGASVDNKNYKVYDMLLSPSKKAITLPSLRLTQSNGESVTELNGVSIFKDGILVDNITPEETKYYLMCDNKLKGSVIVFDMDHKQADYSTLEVSDTICKKSFSQKDNKLTVKFTVDISGNLVELEGNESVSNVNFYRDMESKLEDKVKENILNLIRKTQTQYNADVFGIGLMIYQKDKKLWEQLSKNWDDIYKDIDIQLECNITIKNTGLIK